MSCDSARLSLLAYIHGALSLEDAAAIERHVALCPGCALEADRLRSESSRWSRLMGESRVPDGLEARVMGRLRHRAARDAGNLSSLQDWLRAGALAAASVLIAFSGMPPSTHAFVAGQAALLGARLGDLAGQHIASWPALVRAFEALSSLFGWGGL
jgi:anti-sigma factor RsiW